MIGCLIFLHSDQTRQFFNGQYTLDRDSKLLNHSSILKIKEALLKKKGVLGKSKYFNSAVLIPLIFINNEYHLLFQKRAAEIRQGGEVCFPGGEYDPVKDKSFLDTAIRETVEEIGIKKENIEMIGEMDTLVAPMGVTVDPFVGIINLNNLDEIKIDKTEVEKIFILPISYFLKHEPSKYYVRLEVHTTKQNEKGEEIELFPVKKLKLPGRYSNPWQGREHRVLVYENKEETIWGITAELVYEFCKLIDENEQ